MPEGYGPNGGRAGAERYVVIGLAEHRADWISRVSRWATDGQIPVEFVRTRSAGELHAILDTGRLFSSVLLDATTVAVGRDLIGAVRRAGCVALVVGGRRGPDWIELGAAGVLDPSFDHPTLVGTLASHSRPVPYCEATSADSFACDVRGGECPIVVVTGPPGVGRSTIAIALAEGLGRGRHRRPVALADFCLEADLAVLHGAASEVSGVQHLVESHRLGRPSPEAIRRLLLPRPRYDLLTGLHDRDDWTLLRYGSVSAGLDSLRRAYRCLVVDADADVSGEHDTGSRSLDDRNALSRNAIDRAAVLVVVGRDTVPGVARLGRTLRRLAAAAPPTTWLVPVINWSRPGADTCLRLDGPTAPDGERITSPVRVPPHRQLDLGVADAGRPPAPLVERLTAAVASHLGQRPPPPATPDSAPPIRPGELGHWPDDTEAA